VIPGPLPLVHMVSESEIQVQRRAAVSVFSCFTACLEAPGGTGFHSLVHSTFYSERCTLTFTAT
jgi:hypothetical protein